jgi:hypothetical protein
MAHEHIISRCTDPHRGPLRRAERADLRDQGYTLAELQFLEAMRGIKALIKCEEKRVRWGTEKRASGSSQPRAS